MSCSSERFIESTDKAFDAGWLGACISCVNLKQKACHGSDGRVMLTCAGLLSLARAWKVKAKALKTLLALGFRCCWMLVWQPIGLEFCTRSGPPWPRSAVWPGSYSLSLRMACEALALEVLACLYNTPLHKALSAMVVPGAPAFWSAVTLGAVMSLVALLLPACCCYLQALSSNRVMSARHGVEALGGLLLSPAY